MSYSLTFIDTREGPQSFAEFLTGEGSDGPVTVRIATLAETLLRRWPEDHPLWRGSFGAGGGTLGVALDAALFAEVGNELLDIADRAGIACFDPQLSTVIPPSALKPTWPGAAWKVSYPRDETPAMGELQIAVVAAPPTDEYATIMTVIDAVREHLPLALPVTYDSKARLGVRFRWDERFLFRDELRAGQGWWAARPPFTRGRLSGVGPRRDHRADHHLTKLTIGVDVATLASTATRAMLDDAIPLIAEATGAFYAVGLVRKRLTINGGTPVYLPSVQTTDQLRTDIWRGLPGGHVLLEWFGAPYLPLVVGAIPQSRARGGGLYTTYYADTEERRHAIPADILAVSWDESAALLPAITG